MQGEGSLDDLFCFDTASSQWTRVEPQGGVCPPKRSYHAMAAQAGLRQHYPAFSMQALALSGGTRLACAPSAKS